MFNFPKPKLGDVTAVTITSPDLEGSLKYYQRLGFNEVYRSDFPFPWIQVSDGALLIMLRQGADPYIALTYYVKELDQVVAELRELGITVEASPTPNPLVQRYVIKTDEGHNLTLVSYVEGFNQPPGPTMLTMPPQDYSNPAKYVNQTCGMFGEFAHPVKDLDASVTFWEKLGFKSLSKRTAPYPWAILSDGLSIIGLHQTAQFNEPTITFFASDMKEKIENLKKTGMDNMMETGGSNVVLSTPEQQKINLFKLGF
jgi:catechol 2,3-dioxygenase-like lactoylglutathione lyase family enzyme